MLAQSPWFRLWQHFGVCCRGMFRSNSGMAAVTSGAVLLM